MKGFTIDDLAKQSGVNLETVRYYERRGLLPEPPRSESGYRLYSAEAASRLRFIKRAQGLGFSLKEIEELLSLRLSPHESKNGVRQRAEAKIADIDAKISVLKSMKHTLRKLTKACAGHEPASECPIIQSLDGEEL